MFVENYAESCFLQIAMQCEMLMEKCQNVRYYKHDNHYISQMTKLTTIPIKPGILKVWEVI